ncbi:hypothetical protein [Mesorhizobium koreense]|jgi:hypothetical protein|uniref:hypothetical protein n=1 Tax=Mesorhizobium koreense TaxID=3074855 RepID=UPI00287BC355|nr:hypothetical protein [Mesorhizobium sp. WR6]
MDASNVVADEAPRETPAVSANNDGQVAEKPDTMGFELALQLQDLQSSGFEAAVTAAVDSVGGEVLFDMPLPAETDCQRVAAVSVGSGEERALVLVMLPKDGEALRVETVEESSHPVAGIVAAYVGLMDHLAVAA